ncbi:hypothetical protein QR77_41180 [Streptomyces sp. 150FB]|uniref:hypothetical protein n=1 Tax=Streptomyces sp. 150FB TaxID=1576605 RepID=UPI0005891B97|nr:hypothetical protein [Streptomyces sp. 150FB]KIF72714.1 hypothetical protein QR77_41180 [Streptomyces sp. 150FB]
MSEETALWRSDRARAFVPELIPEPQDLDRSGPLNAREQQDLDRVHAARDHHRAAKWMRGKALEAAFRRRLFRGEDGTRSRQQYLDEEWDGLSESAAYREIGEWRLAKEITDACERPAPDSHVRALLDVAGAQGHKQVAHWYAELRRHGQQTGRRVTADAVANLADFLRTGTEPERLEPLFAPRQLPPAIPDVPAPAKPGGTRRTERGTEPVTDTVVSSGQAGSFPNLGMSDGSASPAGEAWTLSQDHIARLSAWIAAGASTAGIAPELAADVLVEALTADNFQRWIAPRIWT